MICQICHVVHHLNNWQAHDGLRAGKEIGGAMARVVAAAMCHELDL